jgi:hypothetical protein
MPSPADEVPETLPDGHIARGRRSSKRPTLWTCAKCGYFYWSHGDAQDPEYDNHCFEGMWIADERAISQREEPDV